MLSTACLLAILAIYVGLRVLRRMMRFLSLDVWASLIYLGLAELDAPPDRPVRRRARVREVSRSSAS